MTSPGRAKSLQRRGVHRPDPDDLQAVEAAPSADSRRVRLKVPGLKEGRVVYLRTVPPSRDGESLWTTEAWYIMNRLPRG